MVIGVQPKGSVVHVQTLGGILFHIISEKLEAEVHVLQRQGDNAFKSSKTENIHPKFSMLQVAMVGKGGHGRGNKFIEGKGSIVRQGRFW